MQRSACRALLALLLLFIPRLPAQVSPNLGSSADVPAVPNSPEPNSDLPNPVTVFSHPDSARYLIAGQANIILQGHAPFHSPYSGKNSFLARGEYKTSLLGTLYLGYQLRQSPSSATDILFDLESSGGRGLSEALGLAGFTNLDVVRNPSLGSIPYVARVQLHQTFGFSKKTLVSNDRTPFSLSTRVPERRLELHVGKMGLPDFFDENGPGSDSHLQFMNWAVDNNGAWDYAADTRGYTYAAVAEYTDRRATLRYGLALMPTVANGIDLQWNLRRANAQNTEVELRQPLFGHLLAAERKGTLRLLSFVNHANMGIYRDQNRLALDGLVATPDITAHPLQTTVKYGFGLNFEQELTADLRTFGRFGWNEGQHESFAYTEVDQTIEIGADLAADRLPGLGQRKLDKLGLVFTTNAIKRDHQQYLALGGKGFLLGDGRLHYGREDIVESYYNFHTWRGLFYALDAQFLEHPGYNQDRGPVFVESVRMHVDF